MIKAPVKVLSTSYVSLKVQSYSYHSNKTCGANLVLFGNNISINTLKFIFKKKEKKMLKSIQNNVVLKKYTTLFILKIM